MTACRAGRLRSCQEEETLGCLEARVLFCIPEACAYLEVTRIDRSLMCGARIAVVRPHCCKGACLIY